jgi:hypothetical protein
MQFRAPGKMGDERVVIAAIVPGAERSQQWIWALRDGPRR